MKANEIIVKKLDQVKTVVDTLIKQGFEIIKVDINRTRPMIEIEPRRTNRLNGAIFKITGTGGGRRISRFACPLLGCQIEWEKDYV